MRDAPITIMITLRRSYKNNHERQYICTYARAFGTSRELGMSVDANCTLQLITDQVEIVYLFGKDDIASVEIL